MSNIDKQWLQQKIADMEATRDEIPFGLDEDDSNTLAALRIALASLEAEPVAYTDAEELRFPHATSDMWRAPLGHGWDLPLYTAPPLPVAVPDMATPQSMRAMFCQLDDSECAIAADVWNACRAAMLRGAEQQNQQQNIPENIPDGWVMVPVELTPNMRAAWDSAPYTDDDDNDMQAAYRAMIAAAPQQEA